MESNEFEGIPIVRKYKYLGIIIDEKLSWQDHLEYIEKKVEKGLKMVKILKLRCVTSYKKVDDLD